MSVDEVVVTGEGVHDKAKEIANIKTRRIINADNLWPYRPGYWKNKVVMCSNQDDVLDKLAEFINESLAAIQSGGVSIRKGIEQTKSTAGNVMKKIMRESNSIVYNSGDRILKDFKLTKEWLATVIYQYSVSSLRDDNDEQAIEAVKRDMSRIGTLYDWDMNKIFNPKHSNVNTTFPVKCLINLKGEDTIIEFPIVLTPIEGKRTPGMIVESTSGKKWEVGFEDDDGMVEIIECDLSIGSSKYKTMLVSSEVLNQMKISEDNIF